MEYSKFYKDANRIMVNTLLSIWFKGKGKEQIYLREILTKREPLMSEPIFQTVFPWEQSTESFSDFTFCSAEDVMVEITSESVVWLLTDLPQVLCPSH